MPTSDRHDTRRCPIGLGEEGRMRTTDLDRRDGPKRGPDSITWPYRQLASCIATTSSTSSVEVHIPIVWLGEPGQKYQ